MSGGSRIKDDPLIRINIILQDKKIPLKIVLFRKEIKFFLFQVSKSKWMFNNCLSWQYFTMDLCVMFSTKFISMEKIYIYRIIKL